MCNCKLSDQELKDRVKIFLDECLHKDQAVERIVREVSKQPSPVPEVSGEVHTHTDERGRLVKCYHVCRDGAAQVKDFVFSWKFWVGSTVTTLVQFPIEHFFYEKVFPFTIITKWLGL